MSSSNERKHQCCEMGGGIRRKQERGRETSKDNCFPYKRVSRASDQTSSSVNSFLRSCQQEFPPSVRCFVYQSAPIVLRDHWSNDSYLPTPPPDTESQNTSDYLLPHQHYHLVRPFFLPPAHSVLLFMCFKSSSLPLPAPPLPSTATSSLGGLFRNKGVFLFSHLMSMFSTPTRN